MASARRRKSKKASPRKSGKSVQPRVRKTVPKKKAAPVIKRARPASPKKRPHVAKPHKVAPPLPIGGRLRRGAPSSTKGKKAVRAPKLETRTEKRERLALEAERERRNERRRELRAKAAAPKTKHKPPAPSKRESQKAKIERLEREIRNARRREQRAESARHAETLHRQRSERAVRGWDKRRFKKVRDLLLGGRSNPVGKDQELHGSSPTSWIVLKSMIKSRDRRWVAFLEAAEEYGMSYGEAVDEWFSPEM